MSSLSLVAGSCVIGGGIGVDDQGNELGIHSFLRRHSVTNLFIGNGHLRKGLRGSKAGSRNKLPVVAKLKIWKKHEYPWPENLDPNISSGYLRYLSEFKPLLEKPKPVTLPFEKPLVDLEKKIIEVKIWFFWHLA